MARGFYVSQGDMLKYLADHGGHAAVSAKLSQMFEDITKIRPISCGFVAVEPQTRGDYLLRFAVEKNDLETARGRFNKRARNHPINALLPRRDAAVMENEPMFVPTVFGAPGVQMPVVMSRMS